MRELLAAWLYCHPRVRRMWILAQMMWGGSLLAVMTAPSAAAAGLSATWSWTGLHDSYGIPIGAHFVSVVPMVEAIREQGPEFGADPSTWGPAIASKVGTALTYTQLASWLAVECAMLTFIVAVGLWVIKFALSTIWLKWLAAIAEPILANISALVSRMYIIPGMFLICTAIGGVVAVTTGFGTGAGIILGGCLVIALIALLLNNPAEDIAGDGGVLGIGRNLGLTLSQSLANNGPVAPGGSDAQLDRMMSWFVDVLVRQQIQQINFGQVIDDIPGCADAYNQALGTGDTAAPAHAMGTCAPSALAYAQQLDALTVGQFGFLILAIFVVVCAICYVACEVIRIGFRAFWNLLVILPASALAVAPGPQRQFAKRTAVKLVVHGVEMIVATVGLGILILLLAHITRGDLPGLIGMTHPMAKVIVMLLVAIFSAIGFRQLLHGFGDRGLPGPIRGVRFAARSVSRANTVVREGEYAGRKVADLRSRAAERRKARLANSANESNAGPKAPGRKGHPTPASTRPPSTPTHGSATRPGSSGPGRNSGPSSSPATGRPAQQATTGGGKGSAVAKTANAAKLGAKVGGPPGAAAAAGATALQQGASRLRGTGKQRGQTNSPGRGRQQPQSTSPTRADAPPAQHNPPPGKPRPPVDPPGRSGNGSSPAR